MTAPLRAVGWLLLTSMLCAWGETPVQPDSHIPDDLPPTYQPPPLDLHRENAPPIRLYPRISGEITGYFGPLTNRVKAGPGWSAWLCGQAFGFLDLEAGYAGSFQELTVVPPGYRAPGPRYLRQGAQVNVGITLGGTQVQPFVMTGISLADYFTVGGGVTNLPVGFTVGLPVIVGFRMRFMDNHLMVDLRGQYVLESLRGAALLPQDSGLTNRWSTSLGLAYVW